MKTLTITEQDFMLANRRAARQEEIDRHGKPVIFRTRTQKSKKAYNRQAEKQSLRKLYES